MLWLCSLAAAQENVEVVVRAEVAAAPAASLDAPEEMRSGPSVGLSMGVASGFGPTLGIPIGQVVSLQITALPVLLPGAGGGSGGLRLQQYLGKNPRTRLYLVEGIAAHGWDESWLWGIAAGAGVETRKSWSTGLTRWLDVSITAIGTSEGWIVLPLPQAGIAWVF